MENKNRLTDKENVDFFVKRDINEKALTNYADENRGELTMIEFFKLIELPFIEMKILECINSGDGNLKYYFILKKKAINDIIDAYPPQPNESRTKSVVFETLTNIDKQGWKYAFVSEQDYNLFTDLLTNFFEYKPYTMPETIIQLKRGCKTKVAKALGEIHKELSNENKLSTDTKYFQLIRVLSHFEKETEGDLYKALTR
jgi:hypothetical protein